MDAVERSIRANLNRNKAYMNEDLVETKKNLAKS